MTLIQCPECNCEVDDEAKICEKCGFDLLLYKKAYKKIYDMKIQKLNESETL